MTQYIAVLCFICKHYRSLESEDGENGIVSGKLVCDAYPEGAPRKFLGGVEHTQPEPGDRGIQFEPISEEAFREFRQYQRERTAMS